ncbi:hypothetical protein J7J41_03005 [bacterium]|nr:hypothetical protein [bacterium]
MVADYNQIVTEVLEEIEEVRKRIDLLVKKIKKFIPSENLKEDSFDEVDFYLDPQKVIKKYGFPYLT